MRKPRRKRCFLQTRRLIAREEPGRPFPACRAAGKNAIPKPEFPMLTLAQAQTILTTALAHAEANGFKPLAIAVLDARGAQKAFAAQDGTSLKRGEIALGKAHGVIALGV